MGSPHWRRLCLLLLAAFPSSLVLYGHYYATVELPAGQRTIARFLRSELLTAQYGHLYMPSTGALMLLTVLHACDQVSAYGFIAANYERFSGHYYELEKKPLVFYANHDMLLEAELWKSLHQAGIMELYQR